MATVVPPGRDSSERPLVRRPLAGASCPLCHTAASSASAAFAWQCRTCGQHWTASRLQTVAAYDAWRASPDRGRRRRAVVHEQFNFSPRGSAEHVEECVANG